MWRPGSPLRRRLLSQPSRLQVDLIHHRFHAVIGLRHNRGGERVSLDDVAAGFKIGVMDVRNHVRSSEREQIVIALQVAGMIPKALATEVCLTKSMALDHRAHGAIHDQDTLRE